MKKNNTITISGDSVAFINAAGSIVFQRIAPYCDAPQVDGNGGRIIQRFDLESAKRLVAAFLENVKRLAEKGIGNASIPVYCGHPDHVNASDGMRDSEIYARVEALEARNDGLWAKILKMPLLEKLKGTAGRLEISPRWACSEHEDGTFKPEELISLGLVENGNLPGADVINSIQTIKTTNIMDDKTMQKLAELLGCEATAEAVVAAVEQMKAKVAEAEGVANEAQEQAEDEKKKANEAEAKLAAANARIAHLEAEAKKRAEDLANSQKNEAKKLLDAAHLAGKITPAQRPSLEAFFEKDFANAKIYVESLEAPKKDSLVDKIQNLAGGEKSFEALANEYWCEQKRSGRMISLSAAIDEFSRTKQGLEISKK